MTVEQIIFVGVIVIIGSALQSAVGFGFGLFAIPLALWIGVPLPMAVTIMLISTAVQGGWSCWHHRTHLPWRPVIPIVLLRLVTIPIGVLLLGLLVHTNEATIRQVVGVLLLVMIGLQLGLRIEPREKVHPSWTVVAGSSSGILGGLIGMGGPPLVFWLMAHDWPPQVVRSFHWVGGLLLAPVSIGMLWLRFGEQAIDASFIAAGYVPLTLGGTALGLWAGSHLSMARLRIATFVVLIIVSVSLIVSPLLA
ncbi:MAG: TSUP family transporter [Phycisphaeraceae bacterium]